MYYIAKFLNFTQQHFFISPHNQILDPPLFIELFIYNRKWVFSQYVTVLIMILFCRDKITKS